MGVFGKAVYFVWALLFENEVLYYTPRAKDSATNSCKQISDLAALRQLNFEQKLQHFQLQIAQHQIAAKRRRKTLKFVVRRDAVLEDAFRLVMSASKDDLHGRLLVQWAGEEGIDQGGLAKEFFCILSRELFDCKYGLFEPLVSSVGNGDASTHVSSMAATLSDSRAWFRFSGRILGLALLHSQLLDVRLAPSLCQLLLRAPLGLEDIRAQDVHLYRSLCWLRDNNIGAGNDLALTFAVTERRSGGEMVEHELLPGGRNVPVTEQNKSQFLRLMMRWAMRVDGVHRQSLGALMYGLYEIVDWRLINMFSAHEFSLLLSGSDDGLDVDEWRRHTAYGGGYHDDHPVVRCFWSAVAQMDCERRLRLLQFVTGARRLPHASCAAKRFSIYNYGQPNELPRAHTCINRLYLPPYHDAQILRDKLNCAVLECDSFGME